MACVKFWLQNLILMLNDTSFIIIVVAYYNCYSPSHHFCHSHTDSISFWFAVTSPNDTAQQCRSLFMSKWSLVYLHHIFIKWSLTKCLLAFFSWQLHAAIFPSKSKQIVLLHIHNFSDYMYTLVKINENYLFYFTPC